MNYFVNDRVKQIIGQLNILKRNIKEQTLEANKTRARQQITDLLLLVQEAHYQKGTHSHLDIVIELLMLQLERLNEQQVPKETIENVIERLTNLFADNKYAQDLESTRRCYQFADTLEMLDTDSGRLNPLINQISNERSLNVLAFNASVNYMMNKQLAHRLINSYAILGKNTRKPYYLEIQNIAYGSGGNSNITNNAFDVLLLTPPSEAVYTPIGFRGDVIPKQEYLTLINSLKFLRPNGLCCMVMPYTRLDHDLCFYLAKHFTQVQLTRVNEIMVEITGLKITEKVFDETTYATLRAVYRTFVTLPYQTETRYELPQQIMAINNFRGSYVTDEMLSVIQAQSNCFSKISQDAKRVSDLTDHKPLLPFNTGQIGIILASGCLDGVVNEDETHCHLIKGRVERMVDVKKGRGGHSETIIAYHSVQINALTPNGRLIQIK